MTKISSQRKLALTAINFLHYKIIGYPKILKNQPRPFVMPNSVNFCQNFFEISREIVPLRRSCFSWTK
jgi:hypothetical protein